jgi:hypothetical protein
MLGVNPGLNLGFGVLRCGPRHRVQAYVQGMESTNQGIAPYAHSWQIFADDVLSPCSRKNLHITSRKLAMKLAIGYNNNQGNLNCNLCNADLDQVVSGSGRIRVRADPDQVGFGYEV